jgi:hypothetical protein
LAPGNSRWRCSAVAVAVGIPPAREHAGKNAERDSRNVGLTAIVAAASIVVPASIIAAAPVAPIGAAAPIGAPAIVSAAGKLPTMAAIASSRPAEVLARAAVHAAVISAAARTVYRERESGRNGCGKTKSQRDHGADDFF